MKSFMFIIQIVIINMPTPVTNCPAEIAGLVRVATTGDQVRLYYMIEAVNSSINGFIQQRRTVT